MKKTPVEYPHVRSGSSDAVDCFGSSNVKVKVQARLHTFLCLLMRSIPVAQSMNVCLGTNDTSNVSTSLKRNSPLVSRVLQTLYTTPSPEYAHPIARLFQHTHLNTGDEKMSLSYPTVPAVQKNASKHVGRDGWMQWACEAGKDGRIGGTPYQGTCKYNLQYP